MPVSAFGTSEFLFFMDRLFDSVNGASIAAQLAKPLRCALSSSSKHEEFWNEAICVLETMHFFNNQRPKIVPPSIKNWIHTLKGMKYLWSKLREQGFKYLCIRHLNQDPLENFFGQIRSHGVRNVNPTCQSFSYSFKSLIICNICSWSSPSANCEADNTMVLTDLKSLLVLDKKEECVAFDELDIFINVPDNLSYSNIKTGTLSYIAGYIAKRIIKYVKNCPDCRMDLLGEIQNLCPEERLVIESRSYRSGALVSPNSKFIQIFCKSIFVLESIITKVCFHYNVCQTLTSILKANINFKHFRCNKHNVIHQFLTMLTKLFVYTYTKNINKILHGKIMPSNPNDSIKLSAKQYFIKHRKSKKM